MKFSNLLKNEVLSYLLVGGVTQVLDIVTFHFLVSLGVQYILADVLNIPIVLGFNYMGHKFITFKTPTRNFAEILRYIVVVVLNFFFALLLLYLGVEYFHLTEFYAKVFQIAVITFVNYFVLKFLVYQVQLIFRKDA